MKKKIAACVLLLTLAVFFANAYGQYGVNTLTHYWGDGTAGAKYCGTTKNLTIDEVHNDRWNFFLYDKYTSNPQSFSGKLSKRQSRLLWYALDQYDYAPGEIYSVLIREEDALFHTIALTVQIKADKSCTWKGFTYDFLILD